MSLNALEGLQYIRSKLEKKSRNKIEGWLVGGLGYERMLFGSRCRGSRERSNPAQYASSQVTLYMTTHLLSSRSFLTLRATRAASVKASLTPRFLIAEHSKYRRAPMRRATSRPWS